MVSIENSEEFTDVVTAVKTVANEDANGIMQIHTVYQLSCLTGDTDKTDFTTDLELASSTSNLISVPSQDGTVLVDTSKGLVFSVADMGAILASQDTVDLSAITSHEQVTDGQLLDGEVALGEADLEPQLFNKQEDILTTEQTELPLDEQEIMPTGSEQPKKRRGGWPKGKKRKVHPNQDLPRSPATAYAMFMQKRRQEIKKLYPDLPFVEVAKILGSEWSNMSKEEKEVYKEQAEADKKRYVEDLKEYQNSEAYQNIIKRNRIKVNGSHTAESAEGSGLISSILDEEGLFCSVCEQCFSSAHNLREHMFGKQHLQAIANACNKEKQEQEMDHHGDGGDMEAGSSDSDHSMLHTQDPGAAGDPGALDHTSVTQDESLDINTFMINFLEKNSKREKELHELGRSCKNSQEMNMRLMNQFEELKERVSEMKQDLATQRAYGAALATQIDTLRMVPTLFGVINF